MQNTDKKKPVDYCVNGMCSNCDECCTELLPMTREEVEKIKRYVREHNIQMHRHLDGNDLYFRCPFRDSINRKCTIYQVRPKICRLFKCSQSNKIVERNKVRIHKNAFYNRINEKGNITHIASLHALIYQDYEWELQALWGISGGDQKVFSFILDKTYVKYKVGDLFDSK
ncbi:MAG: YkgJ family cysteine cluster protein [Anaeroplasma sp.]